MQRGQAKFKAQSANRANAAKAKVARPKVSLATKAKASSGRVVAGAPLGRPAVRKQGSVKAMQAKQAKFRAQSASRKRATAINTNNTNTAKSKKRFTMTKPVSRNR